MSKTTTSELLKQMYDNALCNDHRQDVLVPVYHHLYALGYELEKPAALKNATPVDIRAPGFIEIPPSYPSAQTLILREPDTNVALAQLDIIHLTDRLNRSPGDSEGTVFQVGNRELKEAVSLLEQLVPHLPTERPIPEGWVPCSPSWLKAGGNCALAPRAWSSKDQNHYHPPVIKTPTRQIPVAGEMTRADRITVGATVYGLYLLGMATTEVERIDEDCAMDNMRVPRRYEDLNIAGRRVLRNEMWLDLPAASQQPGVPFLHDSADGVKGHYNVGRMVADGAGTYLQVWLPTRKEWGTGSGVTWTLDFAERVRIALVDGTEVPEAKPEDIMSQG